jgi:hypothetical protein
MLAAAYTLPPLLFWLWLRVARRRWVGLPPVELYVSWPVLVFVVCARRADRVGWVSLLLVALFTLVIARSQPRNPPWSFLFRHAGHSWLLLVAVPFVIVEIMRRQS